MAERIGEALVRKNLISREQLEEVLLAQSHEGGFLGEILIKKNYVKEEDLLNALAEQFHTRFVSLDRVRVNPQVIKLVPRNMAVEYKFFPIEMRSSVILIAVSNPLDMWPMSVLQEKLDLAEVQIVLAKKNDILQAIQKYYGSEAGGF